MKRGTNTLLFHSIGNSEPSLVERQTGFNETYPAQLTSQLILSDTNEKPLTTIGNEYLPAPILLARFGNNYQIRAGKTLNKPVRQIFSKAARIDKVLLLFSSIESVGQKCDVRLHTGV